MVDLQKVNLNYLTLFDMGWGIQTLIQPYTAWDSHKPYNPKKSVWIPEENGGFVEGKS